MKKHTLYAILVMAGLYFLWWFSGGTVLGIPQKPAPVDYAVTFFVDNFQEGAATIFEAISSFLNI